MFDVWSNVKLASDFAEGEESVQRDAEEFLNCYALAIVLRLMAEHHI